MVVGMGGGAFTREATADFRKVICRSLYTHNALFSPASSLPSIISLQTQPHFEVEVLKEEAVVCGGGGGGTVAVRDKRIAEATDYHIFFFPQQTRLHSVFLALKVKVQRVRCCGIKHF